MNLIETIGILNLLMIQFSIKTNNLIFYYLSMYDKTTIHSILLGICILAYLVSPKTDLSIPIQEVQASQATQTGEI